MEFAYQSVLGEAQGPCDPPQRGTHLSIVVAPRSRPPLRQGEDTEACEQVPLRKFRLQDNFGKHGHRGHAFEATTGDLMVHLAQLAYRLRLPIQDERPWTLQHLQHHAGQTWHMHHHALHEQLVQDILIALHLVGQLCLIQLVVVAQTHELATLLRHVCHHAELQGHLCPKQKQQPMEQPKDLAETEAPRGNLHSCCKLSLSLSLSPM